MSQGSTPIDASSSQPRRSSDDTDTPRLHSLIRRGHTFSGNERNCFFLNTGRGRFANLSAVSGLDFSDDGRAVARVDWDQDGDLDFWIANRNGPQVRFLRNDVPNSNHYLAIRLVGETCNRDAIGARIALFVDSRSQPRRIKTLRAGDGFLSQSSKWIHFGLGNAARIDRIDINWPGGEWEEFRNLNVDHSYVLQQGSGVAKPFAGPARHLAIRPSKLPKPSADPSSSVFLASRVPLPPLDYKSSTGETTHISKEGGKPKLIVLWASWCDRCKSELAELAVRQPTIRDAGLDVLALSVDGVSVNSVHQLNNPAFLLDIKFPFESGDASSALLDKLQIVRDQLFDRQTRLRLPTSILLDGRGQLAAIYDGSVEVDRLLQDVANLELNPEQTRNASILFPGRWIGPPARISLVPIYRQLIRRGFSKDARKYMADNPERFHRND